MKYFYLFIFILVAQFQTNAQSGVLIPNGRSGPDEKILSIQKMQVDICINNQTAEIKVLQIFENHTAQIQEGKYLYALPPDSAVTDFAIWEGVTRLPGVLLEKRRANEVYTTFKQDSIDPGILQIDEETDHRKVFSAKVFPIPPFSTKRLEIEYTQNLPIENFSSHFTFPLKPSFGSAQTAREFHIGFCAFNESPFASFDYPAELFPLEILNQTEKTLTARFSADKFLLDNDFSFNYRLNVPHSQLNLTAFRAPDTISAFELRNPALAEKNADGYFELRAVFNEPQEPEKPPRRVLLAVDTSLSMFGEKLKRAVESTEFLLRNLSDQDEFNLILFGNETNIFSETPLKATPENVEKAIRFLTDSTFSGGTNPAKLFRLCAEKMSQFSSGEIKFVFISDASSTRETIDSTAIIAGFEKTSRSWKFYGLAVGSEANTALFERLAAKTNGFFVQMRETENIDYFVNLLLARLDGQTIDDLGLTTSNSDNFYDVYGAARYGSNGSDITFVGRYRRPESALFKLNGRFSDRPFELANWFQLPEFADFNAHLPRRWAELRINALVKEMDLNGERTDYISEIIALSQKYKILSPYTAFVAAPRALLRPRLIQPGDPVIRVKTDPSIKEVFAVLPFGETLRLDFLPAEQIWQTRFLAPVWMTDGEYQCRLLLTDETGRGFEEIRTFTVDSQAPHIKINLARTSFKAGEAIDLQVFSDRDTAHLTAKLSGSPSVRLNWSATALANVGQLRISEDLPAGIYFLTVSAEDFAHNQSSEEIRLEIQ